MGGYDMGNFFIIISLFILIRLLTRIIQGIYTYPPDKPGLTQEFIGCLKKFKIERAQEIALGIDEP